MFEKKSKKVRILIVSLLFIVFQLVVGAITFPLLVFYGPFESVRDSLVGTAMTTYTHQFIATTFLSDKVIDDIMEKNTIDFSDIDLGSDEGIISVDDIKVSDKVEVFNIDGGNFQGKLIKVHDPTRVAVGYTSRKPLEGETTSTIARRNDAIAAINGGGFVDEGWSGTGGAPLGFIIHDGEVVYNHRSDFALQDTIAFTKSGQMVVGRYSVNKLLEMGVTEGMTFGPPLVINGNPTITSGDGGWGYAPRTAIGQTEDGAVLLLVADGRRLSSRGASLRDIQDIFIENGAVNAANLDGGSSTTMYYNGRVINRPSDSLGERTVPTIFMVMPDDSSFVTD